MLNNIASFTLTHSQPKQSAAPNGQSAKPPLYALPSPLTQEKVVIRFGQNPKEKKEAEKALREIIKTFSIYEMKAFWNLKPGQIPTFEQDHAQAIEAYTQAKFNELSPEYLSTIQEFLHNLRKKYPVKAHVVEQWKPSMPLTEAKEWAATSKFKKILYHLTSRQSKEQIESQGFSKYFASSGAAAFLTPSREVINNLMSARLGQTGQPSAAGNSADDEMCVVCCILNIPHPLLSYDEIKHQFSEKLDKLAEQFPLFYNVKAEYRMKAKKIVYCSIMEQAGIKALSSGYRGLKEGEIMVLDPKVITAIPKPPQLTLRPIEPEEPGLHSALIKLSDYIKPPATQSRIGE